MGQGLHTKMIMIAAQALRVSTTDISISETATNTVPNTSATAASVSSDLNGRAILDACEQLNARLKPYKELLGQHATLKDLAHAAYVDRVNLTASGHYKTPDLSEIWGTGKIFNYFTQGVGAAEVEIDTLTGEWTCLRADIKMVSQAPIASYNKTLYDETDHSLFVRTSVTQSTHPSTTGR